MTPSADTPRRHVAWWCAAALFMLLAVLVAIRVQLVDQKVGTYIACRDCFNGDVILADLVVFGLLASLLLIISCTRARLLARIPLLIVGLIFLVYIADLVVFALYNSRLFMTDAALFISEGSAIWDQFSSGLGSAMAISVFLGLVALFAFLWWMPAAHTRKFRLIMAALLALSFTAAAFFKPAPYVNDWAVESVFVANMSTPSRNRYTPEVEERVLAQEVPLTQWRSASAPPEREPNVILVLLESWSAWHSQLFGGFEDWTPALDRAAQRGLRFDNFHSIGFSTDKGLAGILGGQQIWAPFRHWFESPPFHSMWGISDSLPAPFNQAGYHTAFLTSGPLSLYRKGEWMRDIGFAEVEGNEHPFYQGRPRFSFGSASDQALYERASAWMLDAPQPWLLVLETVSTHQPYRDPESKDRSLEKVMKYADRQFGAFLDRLDAQDFFDSGVLVVVSDHRSMTPMSSGELKALGPAAHSRVPAFAIASEFAPQTVDRAVYSQSDLAPSFQWWVSGEVMLKPFEAVMFDPAFEQTKCAFHERGDRRGLVEVICDEGRGQVILDGDHTRFAGVTDLPPDRQQEVLDVIARQRLEAWQRHLATGE